MNGFPRQTSILAVLLALGLHVPAAGAARRPAITHHPPEISVLVDSIHAHNALRLGPGIDAYNYHVAYGFRHAFDYLRLQGVQVTEVTSGRLDEKLLEGHQMVFMNLVSADLPPFLVSEIFAIKHYIRSGGSLLVIIDHSNCYLHAYKLMPLLDELGIEVKTEIACERAPYTLGQGNGWIAISRFTPHPVTRGLRTIAFETGGTVDDRYAVAWTSSRSWGDQWRVHPYAEGDTMGFYGNWKQDPGERSGPLGVVLAKQLGRGRIVILGDQNMMGDPFINYADNYRLWLNSVSWLTGDSRLANVDPYLNWRPRIRFYDQYVHSAFGNSDSDGFYNIFAAVGRRMWAFAGDDLTSQQVIVFADTNCTLSGDDLAAVIRHLRARRAIVVLGPAITADAPLPALLSQIGAKLGKPVVDSDPTKQTCRWPGYGRLIILKGHEVYQNGFVPPPETAPDEHQQVLLNTVISTLENAMKDAVPALLKGRVANAHPAPLPGAHPIWRAKTGTQSPVS